MEALLVLVGVLALIFVVPTILMVVFYILYLFVGVVLTGVVIICSGIILFMSCFFEAIFGTRGITIDKRRTLKYRKK